MPLIISQQPTQQSDNWFARFLYDCLISTVSLEAYAASSYGWSAVEICCAGFIICSFVFHFLAHKCSFLGKGGTMTSLKCYWYFSLTWYICLKYPLLKLFLVIEPHDLVDVVGCGNNISGSVLRAGSYDENLTSLLLNRSFLWVFLQLCHCCCRCLACRRRRWFIGAWQRGKKMRGLEFAARRHNALPTAIIIRDPPWNHCRNCSTCLPTNVTVQRGSTRNDRERRQKMGRTDGVTEQANSGVYMIVTEACRINATTRHDSGCGQTEGTAGFCYFWKIIAMQICQVDNWRRACRCKPAIKHRSI